MAQKMDEPRVSLVRFLLPIHSIRGYKNNCASREREQDLCRFIEHIGFILEATLKDCAPKGDLLIYTMAKDQCKWLNLKGKICGQTQSASAT
jgi:hypothetical protein